MARSCFHHFHLLMSPSPGLVQALSPVACSDYSPAYQSHCSYLNHQPALARGAGSTNDSIESSTNDCHGTLVTSDGLFKSDLRRGALTHIYDICLIVSTRSVPVPWILLVRDGVH
jgi:hypothetical protein